MVKNKKWTPFEHCETLTDLVSILRDTDHSKCPELMDQLMKECTEMTKSGKITSNCLVRIYLSYVYMSRHRESEEQIAIGSREFTEQIVKYWVERGYDSDELIALGKHKSLLFLNQVALKAP